MKTWRKVRHARSETVMAHVITSLRANDVKDQAGVEALTAAEWAAFMESCEFGANPLDQQQVADEMKWVQ